jgi:hypothetical protein
VNGSAVSSPNFNGTTPSVAATTGINNVYQVSTSSVSSYTPVATSGAPGVIKPDGSSCTVTAGVLTCPGGTGATSIPLCSDSSGSGTAQSCTTSPSFTPSAGSVIAYTTTTANTGTGLTINVNSLGAKSVAKWQGTTTLAANDMLAGKYVLMTYDGTNWEASTIGNAPSGGGSGAWTNVTASVTNSGCGSVTGGKCIISGSTTGTVTFSSIPGTANHIVIVVHGRGDNSGVEGVVLNGTFNGSSAGYNTAYYGNGVSADVGAPAGASSALMGTLAAGGAPAGQASQVKIWIDDYANTTFNRTWTSESINGLAPGNPVNLRYMFGGEWVNTTTAINAVALTVGSSGHFVAGSSISIYLVN